METPSFPRLECLWFQLWRDMETQSFTGLGTSAQHGNPKFPQAWVPPVLVVAQHGNPMFPQVWAPRHDLEAPNFGHDMETPNFMHWVEAPNFRHWVETPNFGRDMETPNFFALCRSPKF